MKTQQNYGISLTIKSPNSNFLFIAFSPDDRTFLTGSTNNTISLWDLKGNELITFSENFDSIRAIAFSPDGQFIYAGSYNTTGNGKIRRHLTPWAFLKQKVQAYPLGALKAAGLKFSKRDLDQLKSDTKKNPLTLWKPRLN